MLILGISPNFEGYSLLLPDGTERTCAKGELEKLIPGLWDAYGKNAQTPDSDTYRAAAILNRGLPEKFQPFGEMLLPTILDMAAKKLTTPKK